MSAFDGKLNFGKPVGGIVLVPDAVDIALTRVSAYLITVLGGVFHDEGVRVADRVVRSFVINTYCLGGGQDSESDTLVADPDRRHSLRIPCPDIGVLVLSVEILAESVIGFYTLDVGVQSAAFGSEASTSEVTSL